MTKTYSELKEEINEKKKMSTDEFINKLNDSILRDLIDDKKLDKRNVKEEFQFYKKGHAVYIVIKSTVPDEIDGGDDYDRIERVKLTKKEAEKKLGVGSLDELVDKLKELKVEEVEAPKSKRKPKPAPPMYD